jgi:hypothetical protein
MQRSSPMRRPQSSAAGGWSSIENVPLQRRSRHARSVRSMKSPSSHIGAATGVNTVMPAYDGRRKYRSTPPRPSEAQRPARSRQGRESPRRTPTDVGRRRARYGLQGSSVAQRWVSLPSIRTQSIPEVRRSLILSRATPIAHRHRRSMCQSGDNFPQRSL